MDAATFRADFPEFSSSVTYPDAQVNLWLGHAARLLPSDRWEDSLDLGTELFTAHYLALGRRDQMTANVGGVPGTVTGPQASKSVDKVSSSANTGAVILDNAGHWNMTTYGIRFLQLARMIGAGGVQI